MRTLLRLVLLLVALAPATASAGYTHYWTWQAPPAAAPLRASLAEMRRLVEARRDLVRAEVSDAGVTLNGVGEDGHEDFVFPGEVGFNFTKTAGKPYDEVVTACLLVARDHFPATQLRVQSDGGWADWAGGRALYEQVLGRAPKPLVVGAVPRARYASVMAPFGAWSGLLYPLLMGLLFYLVVVRGRSVGGVGWSSYYLFWIIGPAVVAIAVSRPAVLLIVPVALVARRWLPDPYLAIKHARRVRVLEADVRANPQNATARRDLAAIWLEKRRPRRALPLLEQALQRDPDSTELQFLRARALLDGGRYEPAVEAFAAIARTQPKFRQGEALLRAADALIALARWEDAEDGLERYVEANRSSVEGWYKRALVHRGLEDRGGAKEMLRNAVEVYRDSPAFHRRRQLGWYLRARLRALAS